MVKKKSIDAIMEAEEHNEKQVREEIKIEVKKTCRNCGKCVNKSKAKPVYLSIDDVKKEIFAICKECCNDYGIESCIYQIINDFMLMPR